MLDGAQPLAAALPASVAEVQHCLRWASEHRVPVVTRGAGTGLSGGARAVDGGLVLSTELMTAIAVDPAARVADVDDPTPAPHGVVVAVEATGVCRSDWHAWQGHDDDVVLPHVPGHELAGTVAAVGADVRNWRVGDRVTTPFVTACGTCPECAAGAQQVCRAQTQPGFTGWGSFAELVALDHADVNLVALPEGFSASSAAALLTLRPSGSPMYDRAIGAPPARR